MSWATGLASGLLLASGLAAAGELRHEVQPEQTLGEISQLYYGDVRHADVIRFYNGLDSSPIRAQGQLSIPQVQEHTVTAGDSWSALSLRYWGDASLHRQLALYAAGRSDAPLKVLGVDGQNSNGLRRRAARCEPPEAENADPGSEVEGDTRLQREPIIGGHDQIRRKRVGPGGQHQLVAPSLEGKPGSADQVLEHPPIRRLTGRAARHGAGVGQVVTLREPPAPQGRKGHRRSG